MSNRSIDSPNCHEVAGQEGYDDGTYESANLGRVYPDRRPVTLIAGQEGYDDGTYESANLEGGYPEEDGDDYRYGRHERPSIKKQGPFIKQRPLVTLQCPKLSYCKNPALRKLRLKLVQSSEANVICVFTGPGNFNACNLSNVGSFCSLDGQFFGVDEVECSEITGRCRIDC